MGHACPTLLGYAPYNVRCTGSFLARNIHIDVALLLPFQCHRPDLQRPLYSMACTEHETWTSGSCLQHICKYTRASAIHRTSVKVHLHEPTYAPSKSLCRSLQQSACIRQSYNVPVVVATHVSWSGQPHWSSLRFFVTCCMSLLAAIRRHSICESTESAHSTLHDF